MNHSKWIITHILGLINYLHLKVGNLNDIQIKIYVNLLVKILKTQTKNIHKSVIATNDKIAD